MTFLEWLWFAVIVMVLLEAAVRFAKKVNQRDFWITALGSNLLMHWHGDPFFTNQNTTDAAAVISEFLFVVLWFFVLIVAGLRWRDWWPRRER